MANNDTDKQLNEINKELGKLSEKSSSKRYGIYSFALTLGILITFAAVYFGASITGFVTFSETVVSSENISSTFDTSQRLTLRPNIENIDALLLSGEVRGAGRAAVFMSGDDERKRLVYFFEGDAEEGESFSNICHDTCHFTDSPEELPLSIEITGNIQLRLDSATYMHSNMIEFNIEPQQTTMDYTQEKTKVINLYLTNEQNKDYSVILFLDGPLSNYFSWQGSMIKMHADEKTKIIPITVRLPSNLPTGTFDHKVTARYIPPDDYEFSGAAPVAEAIIRIDNI